MRTFRGGSLRAATTCASSHGRTETDGDGAGGTAKRKPKDAIPKIVDWRKLASTHKRGMVAGWQVPNAEWQEKQQPRPSVRKTAEYWEAVDREVERVFMGSLVGSKDDHEPEVK